MNCQLKQDYTNRDRQNILNMTKICKEFAMDREQRKKILKAGAKAFKRRSSCEYSNFDEFR